MKTLAFILCFLPLLIQAQEITRDDIIKTMEHQARLVKDAEAKLADAQAETKKSQVAEATAKTEIVKLQSQIDILAAHDAKETMQVNKDSAVIGRLRLHLLESSIALMVITVGLTAYIFRKPIMLALGIPPI